MCSSSLDYKAQLIQEEHTVNEPLDSRSNLQPKTLLRTVPSVLLLICGDLLAIASWFAMLVYASLLWYSHGRRKIDLKDRMFSPELLMDFARPVYFKGYSMDAS